MEKAYLSGQTSCGKSLSCEEVRGEEPWYPTSRKKRARYGAPGVLFGANEKSATRAKEAAEKVDVGAEKRTSGAKARHIVHRLRPD